MSLKNYKSVLFVLALTPTLGLASPGMIESESPSQSPGGLQRNSLLTSISALFLAPTDFNPEESRLTLHPERSELPQYGERNRLTYTYALQEDRTAPLVVVIPGSGGYANAPNTAFLAELAFKQGYSVLTIPSTTHWSFAMAASSDGRTGFLPKDGVDNYRLLLTLKYRLQREENIRPRQYGIIGMSYGGFDGEQLIRQDLRQHGFNFDFLIAINTPANLKKAIEKIDSFQSLGENWTASKKENLKSFGLGRTLDINKGLYSIKTIEQMEKTIPLSNSALAWLASSVFRDSILDSAFVANIIAGKNKNRSDSMPTTITQYIRKEVLTPLSLKQHRSIEDLENENTFLFPLLENNQKLPRSAKVILFTSDDDFLSFPEDRAALAQVPIEWHHSPKGGHLGNLTLATVQNELRRSLQKLKK